MTGTISGGKLAALTNKRLYGEDFYARLGHKGGSTPTKQPKGFAANKEVARLAGAKGGKISKRGVKIPVRVEKTIVSARLEYERMPWWRRFFT